MLSWKWEKPWAITREAIFLSVTHWRNGACACGDWGGLLSRSGAWPAES